MHDSTTAKDKQTEYVDKDELGKIALNEDDLSII